MDNRFTIAAQIGAKATGARRARVEASPKARDVRLAIPRPGQRVDVDCPPEVDAWWQQVA